MKVAGAVGLVCVVVGAALYLLSKTSARDSASDDCRAPSGVECADQKNNPDFTTTAFRVENYQSPLNEEAPSRSNASVLLEAAGDNDLPWKERMINAAFEDENAVAIPDLNNPGHWIVYFKNLSGEESNVASSVSSSSKAASARSADSKGTRRHADLGANSKVWYAPKRGQPLVVRHPTDRSKDEIVFKYPPMTS